jgi:serine/threonine protein kinase
MQEIAPPGVVPAEQARAYDDEFKGDGWESIAVPEVSMGNLRRPTPNVRRVRPAKTVAAVRAQEWMTSRLEDVSLQSLGSDQSIVIYSTHEIEPPSQFEDVWHLVTEQHRRARLDNQLLSSATVALIFCDIHSKDHMHAAIDVADSIVQLGKEAPPVILIPHSVSPEMRSEGDESDKEFEILAGALDSGIDDVVIGEPSGIKLSAEIRSKIMIQARDADTLNKKLNERRNFLRYVCELEDGIEESVWDYLRVRLRTALPPIDENIEPGVPRTVEDLIVGQKLGEGAFGVVCRLVSPDQLNISAGEVLKLVDKKPITNFHGIAALKRQISVMQMLSSKAHSHPNIAKFFAVYHTETHVLFRIEYGGPLDLYKRLVLLEEKDMKLGINKAASILSQCMAALCHMHLGPQVAHRDLKPENIIVSERGDRIDVKLSDFDTAHIVAKPGSLCRGTTGTFPFMAPEVLLVRRYEPFPADIWSMAIVFLEVLCRVSILKKALELPSIKQGIPHAEKMELERSTMEKISSFFSVPDNASMILQKYVRDDLQNLIDHKMTVVHEGMLAVNVPSRWSAADIWEGHSDLFPVDDGSESDGDVLDSSFAAPSVGG